MISGVIPGSIGSTSVIAILLGLAYLMITGVASIKIIFSGIAGAAVMGLLFNLFDIGGFASKYSFLLPFSNGWIFVWYCIYGN